MIFKNIDGTTKQSFKIGVRGVTISTGSVKVDPETAEEIQTLLVNGSATLSEDNLSLFIPSSILTKAEQFNLDNGGKKIVIETQVFIKEERKWKPGNQISFVIPPDGEQGDLSFVGEKPTLPNEFAVFSDTSGKKVSTSGLIRTDRLFKEVQDRDGNMVPLCDDSGLAVPIDNMSSTIPTAEAVVTYIQNVETILLTRLKGKNIK